MSTRLRRWAGAGLVVVFALAAGGCQTKAQSGALIGGASGAGIGAIIGNQSGHTGGGALIGAAVGTVGGYIVGNEMDKADQRERDREMQSMRRSPAPAARPVTQQDVIAWTKAGEREEVIIDRIQRSGSVFQMTAADENRLRDNEVSEDVIRAMKNTAR